MNIRDFENYRLRLQSAGIEPGLERIRELCEKLGNPQKRCRYIHVTGTNGKGSVCAYVSQILKEAGYKVGRFTSPAVLDEKERYWINGRNVSRAALCRNMEEVKAAADMMVLKGKDEPTLFEVECALAFMIFAESGCDIVVLECGMGGMNDATNVIDAALVSVFTPVSLDHTRYLGKTVDAIAREKSGIIKQGTHVVTSAQVPAVMEVIRARSTLKRADVTVADVSAVKNIKYSWKSTSFDFGRYRALKISMLGAYQVENAALAVSVIEILRKSKIRIGEEHIRSGLEKATWPGRFEVIARKPLVIVDGAHNEQGAVRLAESVRLMLKDTIESGRLIYVFGVLGDKNYPAIAQEMCEYAAQIITVTPPDNPRSLPAVQLAETVRKFNEHVSTASSVEEAVEMAYLLADPDSAIVAFGSLSFLGRFRETVESGSATFKKKQTRV